MVDGGYAERVAVGVEEPRDRFPVDVIIPALLDRAIESIIGNGGGTDGLLEADLIVVAIITVAGGSQPRITVV